MYQLNLQRDGLPLFFSRPECVEKHLSRASRNAHHRLAYDTDGWLQRVRKVKIVIAHNSNRLRNSNVELPQDLVSIYCDRVLDTEDCIDAVLAAQMTLNSFFRRAKS